MTTARPAVVLGAEEGAAPEELVLRELRWRPWTRPDPTLDGLTLRIPAGQRVLLAGPSGSGKSTVLRALAGLLDPEDGELAGTAPGPAERAGQRGLLLQNPSQAMVGATVTRDAAFGPENAALPRQEIHERVAAALEAARVDVEAGRPPLDCSGGQQQRIALAGALALHPGALLLDEPTSMLDPATAAAVRDEILRAADGRTLVVADHDVAAWADRVDRLVVLGAQGRILADGSPAAVLATHHEVLEAAGVLPRAEVPPPSARPPAGSPDPADGSATAGTRPGVSRGEVVAALRGVRVPARGLRTPVDLVARSGELTVLTGVSGAGKSTLLDLLLDPSRAPSTAPTRRAPDEPDALGAVDRPGPGGIAAVPQDPSLGVVAATVREELTASPFADPERAGELLRLADLAPLADVHPHRLSGGEQRRLALAAALAQRPRLLVLDEPTVGLDAGRSRAVLALLHHAADEGCAVLAATHDPALVAAADARVHLPAPSAPARPPAPRRVPADALNPLTLCLIGILAAIGSFAVSTWQGGLLALLPLVVLAPLTVRSLRGGLLRLVPVLLAAAGLAWTTALLGEAAALSAEGWRRGLAEALRLTTFVAPGVLALGSVDPSALGDALGGRLRWPGRPVAAAVAALVRVGHLQRQWHLIVRTRILRGLGTARSPRLLAGATLSLLVDTLRGAEQQALAMDARGFATARHRTWSVPSPLGRADLLGLLLAVWLLVWPAAAELLVR
ncbi:ATP-binding cassette domain-containing protein [Brachybacterium sp. J153]|uniref:ATP-binding cassette domain-containing protein n=1 Tax=Brachybacterium sp. J153 TaxID=3116488 RepID=UPI002E7748FA|nr:ATP-binding cassette domain-containing protein [Brachybacterium sp. J153]MEE1619227.1 ATP-binding cassette domain-containing protein [Brachybacterium sp. J153]